MRFFKKHRPVAPTSAISTAEFSFAMEIVCRAVQKQTFPNEHESLKLGNDYKCEQSSIIVISVYG